MLAFCLCLVFNAHPDFWLPDAAIDAKYSHRVLKSIATTEESLRSIERDLAVDQKNQVLVELAKSLLELNKELKVHLLQERFDNRARLLLNKPPRKRP
jgi:hypothetical protein